ncbi:MAG: toxin-antitoxin system HicB family antitoxin [Vicinamibacteria bacterium]
MSTLSLRLPNSLHRQLKEISGREGVSINQFIASAAGEKVAALLTADYLGERSARGRRAAFDAVLRRVPDVAPDAGDAIPAPKTTVRRRRRSEA